MVVFRLSCLFAPCHGAVQVDEHGPYHDDNSCTIAADSFDVAILLGTYRAAHSIDTSVAVGVESSDDESWVLGNERSTDEGVFQSRSFLTN